MVETRRSPRLVPLEVDDDANALAKIERELSDRYGKGYRVVCEAASEVGIEALERCKAYGEDVALMLADRWMELVAQLYRRVARYVGPRGDHKSAHGTNRIGPCASCACSWAGL